MGNYRITGVFYQNTMVFYVKLTKIKPNFGNTNMQYIFQAHHLRNCGRIHKIGFGSLKKIYGPFDLILKSVSLML